MNNEFAKALNTEEVEAGIEDGSLYLTIPKAPWVPKKVGEFTICQTNSGPDVYQTEGGFGVSGYINNTPVHAIYINGTWAPDWGG